MSYGHQLGIDFGTSTTIGVLRRPDGDVRALLVDGSPLLPSAVYAAEDGRLLVGRDAVHAARLDPGRLEPSPKRRIADGTVLLGDREVEAVALVAAVLARVAEEAGRVAGAPPAGLTLTHPASWGSTRRALLAEAARRAGLPVPRLVPEPVAAASYFTEVLRHRIPAGSAVVVYDFGAGTFDASAVIRGAAGFETAVVDGLDDTGGLDVDAAIVAHLAARHAGRDPAGWQRLTHPATPADRQHRHDLWTDARTCKEQLSRASTADLAVVPLNLRTHLTRAEFEALARPLVERTVQTTLGVLRHANLRTDQVAGVFLVGGSSRIPLVAADLHRRLGIAPTIIEQPELVVAEGSLRLPATATDSHATRILPVLPRPVSPPPAPNPPSIPPPASIPPPVSTPPSTPGPVPTAGPAGGVYGKARAAGKGPGARKRRRGLVAVVAGIAALAVLGAVGWYASGSSSAAQGGSGDGFVPAGWAVAFQDELTGEDHWKTNVQDDQTSCVHGAGGMTVHKQRQTTAGATGMFRCQGPTTSFTDVAVRITARVTSGCVALWVRTGDVHGYFVDACGKTVSLYLLGDTDPSNASRLGHWQLKAPVAGRDLDLGVVDQGDTLTVFAGDRKLGHATDTQIPAGEVDLGAYTGDNGNGAQVVYQGVSVWRPASR
jgi:hypothetical protein